MSIPHIEKKVNIENEENYVEPVKKKFDLDTILIEELGQFGLFQLKTLLLAIILAIFSAWAASEYVFTTSRINSRCLIPECDGENPEFTPSWLGNAVPSTGEDTFDNCQRFESIATSNNDTCPVGLFDRDVLVSCEAYVYENTHSVAYDYDLACDEWRRSLIGTVRTFGTLTALPLIGFISDRWGRRVALTVSAFNTACLGVARYWADTYVGFVISEFAEATFGSGIFSTVYILLMELTGPKYRVAAGATMNTSFSVGQVLMGLIAWGVPSWRNLTLALYAPQLLTISYYWLISESVRWYMSKGRYTESEMVLKKVAQVNGKKLSEKSLKLLRESAEEEAIKKRKEESEMKNEPWLIVQVFRHKNILFRCMISPVWWITTTFIYYGLSINAVNMSGNRYVNYIAVSAVEIPGYWTSVYLLSKVGRKPVLTGAFWICGACQIAYIFMPSNMYSLSLTVYLIAKFTIAMTMTGIYVYTAELYPTKYRHMLFAYSSMLGRIGSMIAPLTPAFGAQWFDDLPFVLFATFALVSGTLIFFTPETLGTKLPDTFEDAEAIGRKRTKDTNNI